MARTIHDHHKASSRKKTAPAPVVLTPEQLAAQAAREARNDAYLAARASLLSAAMGLAERLNPGRVKHYARGEDFSVMFGAGEAGWSLTFPLPGLVELRVSLSTWSRLPDSDEFVPPSLTFCPRSYSLGSESTLDSCAALGQALLDAAALGRTLLALTSTVA